MPYRITLAAALLAASPALAGGFTQPILAPVPAAPVMVTPAPVVTTGDWSGAYVGGQLGFGRLNTDLTYDADGEQLEEEVFRGEGALFGVHAGYMFDFGRFVAGGELDFDSTQIGVSISDIPDADDIGEIESIGRAKLRVGYDLGRVLPYLTAGLARASASFDDEFDDDDAPSERDDTFNGQFIGVGASFALSERLVIGAEAMRHNFDGTASFVADEFAGDEGFDTTVNTVTLRGSFRF